MASTATDIPSHHRSATPFAISPIRPSKGRQGGGIEDGQGTKLPYLPQTTTTTNNNNGNNSNISYNSTSTDDDDDHDGVDDSSSLSSSLETTIVKKTKAGPNNSKDERRFVELDVEAILDDPEMKRRIAEQNQAYLQHKTQHPTSPDAIFPQAFDFVIAVSATDVDQDTKVFSGNYFIERLCIQAAQMYLSDIPSHQRTDALQKPYKEAISTAFKHQGGCTLRRTFSTDKSVTYSKGTVSFNSRFQQQLIRLAGEYETIKTVYPGDVVSFPKGRYADGTKERWGNNKLTELCQTAALQCVQNNMKYPLSSVVDDIRSKVKSWGGRFLMAVDSSDDNSMKTQRRYAIQTEYQVKRKITQAIKRSMPKVTSNKATKKRSPSKHKKSKAKIVTAASTSGSTLRTQKHGTVLQVSNNKKSSSPQKQSMPMKQDRDGLTLVDKKKKKRKHRSTLSSDGNRGTTTSVRNTTTQEERKRVKSTRLVSSQDEHHDSHVLGHNGPRGRHQLGRGASTESRRRPPRPPPLTHNYVSQQPYIKNYQPLFFSPDDPVMKNIIHVAKRNHHIYEYDAIWLIDHSSFANDLREEYGEAILYDIVSRRRFTHLWNNLKKSCHGHHHQDQRLTVVSQLDRIDYNHQGIHISTTVNNGEATTINHLPGSARPYSKFVDRQGAIHLLHKLRSKYGRDD